MNKDKVIKDLKERNDKLKMQYEYSSIRCISLEMQNERLEKLNKEIELLYKNLEAKDKIINSQALEIAKLKEQNNKILYEITNFCEECSSNLNCPEEECVLYRIEQNILGGKENE